MTELKLGMRVREKGINDFAIKGTVERVDVVSVRTDNNILFHFHPEDLKPIPEEVKP